MTLITQTNDREIVNHIYIDREILKTQGEKIYEKSNLYERNDCRRWIKCYL